MSGVNYECFQQNSDMLLTPSPWFELLGFPFTYNTIEDLGLGCSSLIAQIASQVLSKGTEENEEVLGEVYLIFPHCVNFQEKARSGSGQ